MKPFATTLQAVAVYQSQAEKFEEKARQLFEARIAAPAREFVVRGRLITGCPAAGAGTEANVPGPMPAYLKPGRVSLRKSRRVGFLVVVGIERDYQLESRLGIRWGKRDPLKPVCFPLVWLENPDEGLEKLREFHEARKRQIEARTQKEGAFVEARIAELQTAASEFSCSVVRSAHLEELQTELARLRRGGCVRDQTTTQFCAEAAALVRPEVTWEHRNDRLVAARGCFRLVVDDCEGWAVEVVDKDNLYALIEAGPETGEAGKKACYAAWLQVRS